MKNILNKLKMLNGWRRLWVVISVISFCLATFFFASTYAPPGDLFSFEAYKANAIAPDDFESLFDPGGKADYRRYKKKYPKTKISEDEFRFLEKIENIPGSDPERAQILDGHYSKLKTEFEIEKSNVPRNKILYILEGLTFGWFIPIGALYLLGWSLGWIRDGFKKK
ncbi:MAG: hypothetical protein ACI9BD_000183 [Candidatus Marinamargulisbacteria bacterium]|jgi:hypothetical protein